jgi:hypothetical protein
MKSNYQNLLYNKVLIEVGAHSEHGKVIKCDFKWGSVERSKDLYQRGCTSAKVQAAAGGYLQSPPPIKIEQFLQWA